MNHRKEDYQIAISQDGKFAVTFDTGKRHCRKQFMTTFISLTVPFTLKKNSKPLD
jgi:hypothetical protein